MTRSLPLPRILMLLLSLRSTIPFGRARHLTILVVLALATINAAPADDSWVVRENGAGRVRIGMNVTELNAALHQKFVLPAAKDDQGCFYIEPAKQPKLSFMMLEGRLARINVKEPGVFTSTGIQVGDSEKNALKAFGGRLKVERINTSRTAII